LSSDFKGRTQIEDISEKIVEENIWIYEKGSRGE
jgi:hypothetical protein